MAEKHKVKIGKNGTLKFPEELRRLYDLREGKEVTIETSVEGIVINPVSDDRIAKSLLNNAVDQADYERARVEVVKMGLHPDQIEHVAPGPRPDWLDLIEVFTDERIAEFLLNNAIGEDEYWIMRKEVVKLGLDPDTILHHKPDGTLVEERN